MSPQMSRGVVLSERSESKDDASGAPGLPGGSTRRTRTMKRLRMIVIALARRIGQVQAWLILTCLYVLVLAPVAVIFKALADPLRLRRAARSMWHTKSPPSDRWAWAKSQS